MAGFEAGFGKKKPPTPLQSAYTNYGTATKKQAGDYDDIMGKYKDTYASIPSVGSGGSAIQTFNANYTKPTYTNTADYTTAIGTAKNRAQSGVYSPSDVADIRERGISPIRSVYANAGRNINRQRALQGGYSPNYTAVSAKMAREMSSQLSDATTRVNAQIAQDIAAQKQAAQSEYLGAAANEQNQRNRFGLDAAEMDNRYGLSKLGAQMEEYWMPTKMKMSALEGMRGMYGTTPAFASLMQSGAQNQGALESNVNQNNANNQLRLMQIYGGR